MRKLAMLAGLLLAAALVPGVPARAAVGCQCVKFGAPSVCMPTVLECNAKMGGICVAPCAYSAQKMDKRHVVKKHKVAKRAVVKKKAKKKMGDARAFLLTRLRPAAEPLFF
jgi:hypothetical protein